ncbi:hypothetical protein [Dokdonia sp.]|uniref:hypothetical protein n=1 Tax=Dokdonia sp. TaxID=2024995 RepID=UPI003263460F
MRNRITVLFTFVMLVLALNLQAQETEAKLQEIQLKGYIADRESEISGMAWYNDYLILLPQYPEKKGEIYSLHKKEILEYLSNVEKNKNPNPLRPKSIKFTTQFWKIIDGYEGFESIVFDSRTGESWLTIEFEPEQSPPYSVIVKGQLSKDMTSISIDPIEYTSYVNQKIPSQSDVENMAEEALILTSSKKREKSQLISFHEANGVREKDPIYASVFSKELQKMKPIEMPIIPFRITDATALDSDGHFWVINYFYHKEKALSVVKDQVIEWYDIEQGITHQKNPFVERLVELQYKDGKISLSDHKPIQLELEQEESRNWEGIVRLENKGFLLITDKFPTTILAFVSK